MMHLFRGLGVAAVGLLLATGCGGKGKADDEEPETFLAFATHFQNFRKWTPFHLDNPPDQANVHISGPRTEFLNKVPPAGATTFPVGTIIIKELEVGDVSSRKVFGMVKRGGGFNADGAKDWEWFELQNTNETDSTIIWRGVGPPAGEQYGGDPNANCNSCHVNAKANDFVNSPLIRL